MVESIMQFQYESTCLTCQSNQLASCTTHSLPDKGKRFVVLFFKSSVEKREKKEVCPTIKYLTLNTVIYNLKLAFVRLHSNSMLFFNRKKSKL